MRSSRNQLQGNSPEFAIFSKLEQTRQRLKRREFILKLTFSPPLPSSSLKLPSIGGGGGGILPIMAHTGRLHPKGVPFLRFQQCEMVGVLPFEVYERVGKSVFSVCKRAQNGLRMHLMVVKKLKHVLVL